MSKQIEEVMALAALSRCARSNPQPPNNNRPSAGFSLD